MRRLWANYRAFSVFEIGLTILLSLMFAGVLLSADESRVHRVLEIAILVPLIVQGATVAHWRRLYDRERRRKRGLCIGCGYDLRGTPERCPECGMEVAERADRSD